MSTSSSRVGLYIFVLVVNMVFPMFGYTFTTFGSEPQDYEISLDVDTMNMAGITLIDAESNILTFDGGWGYWVSINVTIRGQFMSNVYYGMVNLGDGIAFQKQSAVGQSFNSWLFPYSVTIKSIKTNNWYNMMSNSSIVREWSDTYNWSRFILGDGHQLFITPNLNHNNITRAVYQDGALNVTIAKTFETDTHFNFWSFLGWYSSILIGSNSWGLPAVFGWIIRILGALSIMAIIMLTKELIRI